MPSWNTQTTTPIAAAIESRKPAAALIGTSTDRNTTISSNSANPITTAVLRQRRSQRVGRVDVECRGTRDVRVDSVLLRTVGLLADVVDQVRGLIGRGPVFGVTIEIVTSPASFRCGGETAATFGISLRLSVTPS